MLKLTSPSKVGGEITPPPERSGVERRRHARETAKVQHLSPTGDCAALIVPRAHLQRRNGTPGGVRHDRRRGARGNRTRHRAGRDARSECGRAVTTQKLEHARWLICSWRAPELCREAGPLQSRSRVDLCSGWITF